MADFTPADVTPSLPPLWVQLATMALRHGLTALAGFLVTKGLLSDGQSGAFVDVAFGLLAAAVSAGWSTVSALAKRSKFFDALYHPAPKATTRPDL